MNENKKRQEKAKLERRFNWCIVMFLGATITLAITVNTNCTLNLVLGTSCIILIALLGIFTNAAQYDDIKLEPLPEPLDDAISSDHGDDLGTVMESIRREPLEYWAIFDEDGDKLAEGTLRSPYECNLAPCDQWAIRYAEVNVHNHPGTREGSFSDADMKTMMAYSMHRSMVVTQNYTYSMENPYWEDEEYPFDESDFRVFVDKKWEKRKHSIFTKPLHWVPAFARWYTIYISYSIARHFGLKFHVQNHRLERFKKSLWTRKVQQCITRYAAVFGIAIIMFIPSTPSGYATNAIARNTQDIKVIYEQELVYDENYGLVLEIEEKSSIADGNFQPVEPF